MDITVTTVILRAGIAYKEVYAIDWMELVKMGASTILKNRDVLVKYLFFWFKIVSKIACQNFYLTFEVSSVCRDGFYNSRCTSQCGKCVNDEPCDKVTGECRNGCQQHFEPPLCQGL